MLLLDVDRTRFINVENLKERVTGLFKIDLVQLLPHPSSTADNLHSYS